MQYNELSSRLITFLNLYCHLLTSLWFHGTTWEIRFYDLVIFQLTCHRSTLSPVPRNVQHQNVKKRTIDNSATHFCIFKANCCWKVHNAHFRWHRQFLDKMTITLLKVTSWIFFRTHGMKLGVDPWFLRQGCHKLFLWSIFPKKTHEMEKNWLGRGRVPYVPLDPQKQVNFNFPHDYSAVPALVRRAVLKLVYGMIPIQLVFLDATKISLLCVDIQTVLFRNPLKIKSEIVLDFIYLTLRR